MKFAGEPAGTGSALHRVTTTLSIDIYPPWGQKGFSLGALLPLADKAKAPLASGKAPPLLCPRAGLSSGSPYPFWHRTPSGCVAFIMPRARGL